MRTQRNALLAGLAALAIIAGTGFASAQETQNQKSTAPNKQPPAAAQQINKGPAAGKMGQSAQEENRSAGAKAQETKHGNMAMEHGNKTAKTKAGGQQAAAEHHKRGAMARHEASQSRRTAEERNRMRLENTAQRERNRMEHGQRTAEQQHNDLEGLQGNAAGAHVQLNAEQRTRIRETVLDARGASRVGDVNFNVAVGTVIPRGGVHVVPVPRTLVQIEPTWLGFLYFVWNDEVVIVNPRDMRIVAVVAV